MRQTHVCPKCGNNRLLAIARVDRVLDEYGRVESWHIARVPEPVDTFPLPGGEPVDAGIVQAYVCKECGFTEFYTEDPESIPVDGNIVSEIVGPEGSGILASPKDWF